MCIRDRRYIVIGSHGTGIPVGSRLDATNTTTRVVSTDSSARAAAGVPSSGTVKSGTSVSGKSGSCLLYTSRCV